VPADKDWDKLLAHNAYYLVNNYHPGYIGTGGVAYVGGPNDFTIPPSRQNNIGLLLSNAGVSWHYYGKGWEAGLTPEFGRSFRATKTASPQVRSPKPNGRASLA